MMVVDDLSPCSCYQAGSTGLGWPAMLILFIPVLSLISNSSLCAVICRPKSSLKTTFNAILMSIAVCDMILAAIIMPLGVYKAYNGHLSGPLWLCDLWLNLVLALTAVVGCHLVALSVTLTRNINPLGGLRRLTPHKKYNPLPIILSWIAGLLLVLPFTGWEYSKPCPITTNQNVSLSNSSLNSRPWDSCHGRSPQFILVTIVTSYVVPLCLCIIVFGISWCRLKRMIKGVFRRPHTGHIERIEEALIASIKENGHKSETMEFAEKLTASLRRANSGSRRSSKKDTIQHRSSVLDRHPSLRYSIKRNPSTKGENAQSSRSSMRRSCKNSPNPNNSGHQSLVAKLSWNSAVSEMDQPHCTSPVFLENTPTCHSIADLASAHSTDIKLSPPGQPQSSSYCNLFIEPGKPRSKNSGCHIVTSVSQITTCVSVHDDASVTTSTSVNSLKDKNRDENDTQDSGSSKSNKANEPKVTENVEDPADFEQDSKSRTGNEIPDSGQESQQKIDETDRNIQKEDTENGGNRTTDLDNKTSESTDKNSVLCKDEASNLEHVDGRPVNVILEANQDDIAPRSPGINQNLLSTSYHYESLPVADDAPTHKRRSKKEHSPKHNSRVTVQDLRILSVTLGVLLLVSFLSYLMFYILYSVSIWQSDCRILPSQAYTTIEWIMYIGSAGRPFIYLSFHLSLRTAFMEMLHM